MAALGGVHTAGIYADMTVDGPEIGTLVVVMDRAKNLPNRKTMGKQDPYCAARLGKEAKKTETDRRGGQTPKWDQELRFTVHDSPDYYQLKVSVFNDDKKTELIGETWVALDQIVVPGGGQNDLWHNLNCKGRYAGEIRIELTYYDTRPRDEKAEEKRQPGPINGATDHPGSGISGPRQPKPIKRRPLPADPTNSPCSIPLPQTPPSYAPQLPSSQQRYVESQNDYGYEPTPPSARRHQCLPDGQQYPSPLSKTLQQPSPYNDNTAMVPSAHQNMSDQSDIYGSIGEGDYRQESNYTPNQTPLTQRFHNQQYDGDMEHGLGRESRGSKDAAQPVETSKGMVHLNSSPAIVDARPRQHAPLAGQYSGTRIQSNDESPTSQYSRSEDYGAWPNAEVTVMSDDGVPPPPPAHRHSSSRASHQPQGRVQSEPYTPVSAPAPLNVRIGPGSVASSPLSQVRSNSTYPSYPLTSPTNIQAYPDSAPSVSSRTSYSQLENPRSRSPVRDYGPMPPSLMPGYEPGVAEEESERIMHENRMTAQQQFADQLLPEYQQAPAAISLPRGQAGPQAGPHNGPLVQDRRPHRSSAPVTQPQPVELDPRTPMRKSLSPQPSFASHERRQSSIPFSPDSFDAFNPSLSEANSINPTGPGYNTPEQAKEAFREHERQKKLGDGPIIAHDGRIIDPSDHLPTDTWAPEPEQKKPKKGPEVTIRFRQSPRGAQPMPSATRPPLNEIRPHSISATPIYAHSSDSSPIPGGRARLQKKSQAPMVHPASSPIVPTLKNTPRSSPLQPAVSEYPLREHDNYGGYGSRLAYQRGSPGNIPPPVPGKVPINVGQEDWGMSALSEEMRRIDIGVGPGQERNRSRYGL